MTLNIALIAPTPLESERLRKSIYPEPGIYIKVIYQGELSGKIIFIAHSGVGKVNAAHMATLMLENYDIDLMIAFGIGGAYLHSGLGIGDVAVAESENYAEEGVLTVEGWKSMEFTGLPLLNKDLKYYNTFPLDKELVQFATKTLSECGFNVSSGNFITVSQCSGTGEAGEIIEKRFNGICENTEGAALAHLCALYNKPVIEIRAISNIIEDRDLKKWNIPLAASNCNNAVIELVKRLR